MNPTIHDDRIRSMSLVLNVEIARDLRILCKVLKGEYGINIVCKICFDLQELGGESCDSKEIVFYSRSICDQAYCGGWQLLW